MMALTYSPFVSIVNLKCVYFVILMEDVSGIFMEYSMYSTVCSGTVLFLAKYKQKMNERFYRSVFLFTVCLWCAIHSTNWVR